MEDLPTRQAIIWPVVTRERFAEMTGLDEEVVRGMIERGQLSPPAKSAGTAS